MDRKAWIMATRVVKQHGAAAARVVELKLDKMQRDGVREDQFRHWCWVGRAVFEILREPDGVEAIH